jgi:CheY-like chemotaxis protein
VFSLVRRLLSDQRHKIEGANVPDRTILVVEDDEGIRETLRMVIELEGYKVNTASNGREALELLSKTSHPSLILLDLMMPEMNGWEFAEAVQSDGGLSQIPIAVVTAYSDKAKTIPAKAIIKKPVDMDQLFGVVHEYCG